MCIYNILICFIYLDLYVYVIFICLYICVCFFYNVGMMVRDCWGKFVMKEKSIINYCKDFGERKVEISVRKWSCLNLENVI